MIKRIIFLGGEDVSARIAISKNLVNLGYEVEIVGSEDGEIFAENNIKYRKLELNRELNFVDDFTTLRILRGILYSVKNETIVHAFDTKLTIFLPLASVGLKKIKVIRTINGMGRIFTGCTVKNRILILIYKIVQKVIKNRVDFTIFQNTDNYNYFLDNGLVNPDTSVVIKSSGIDLDKYSSPISELTRRDLGIKYLKHHGQPTFILVSRLIKQKGVQNFLEAAKIAYDNGNKFNFLLIGQLDSNKDSLSIEFIKKYRKYVKYLGKRKDIRELLSLSDVFVLPTFYSEGVPRVLLEASAMSLALITTNMPGCNDVLIDQINGLIVAPNDTKDLYGKMVSITKDPEGLVRMKQKSLEHVTNFSLTKVTFECNKVYSIIGRKGHENL
ncbi:glycosyltransferase [bacterium]|nr:glycosyltransferase [bacterium]